MDIIIKKQELENISSLLPTIIYNELLKFTEEPISIEGDVTIPTTESVVETKIDKSVLLIKIKLFKKALEKDKSNKVLKIKIKLFEKELTKYAKGGGVDKVYKLIDGENTWYLTYLDSTHFFLSNTKEYKGSAYHIGEFRSRPFYNEVLSWLNSNKGKMAKGGGVDYNENREMVLNNNKQIAHHTKELQSAVKGKNVPAWVVAKVNRSASDLSDSTHYMEGQGESYADGGGIKIGDKVMLPEIKMRDGKIQFEKVENGEVVEIENGIYSVLNPKTNRIHKVSLDQIKFNNGGSLEEFLAKKRGELNSYSDERIAKIYSDLMEIDYTDTLIELKGNAGERRNMIKELMNELTIRYKDKFAKGGVFNGKYLNTISADKKNKILKNIANNYGCSLSKAEAEVVDADAEMLYEYIANDQSLRMSVYNDFEGGKFAKGNTVKGGGVGDTIADRYARLTEKEAKRLDELSKKVRINEQTDAEDIEWDKLVHKYRGWDYKGYGKFAKGNTVKNNLMNERTRAVILKIQKNRKHPNDVSPNFVNMIANENGINLSSEEVVFISDNYGKNANKFADGGGTSKIWIVNIAMPTSNNNMPKLIKKEIELGRLSNEFDVKQAILRKGGDWLGNGKVLSVYEKK
tara:strand:- start:1294 stop:3186 length:1893 start_codon:yes stop_codon:yes gene_type:complete